MAIGGIRIDTRIDTRMSIRIGEVADGAPTTKKGITLPEIHKRPLLQSITASEALLRRCTPEKSKITMPRIYHGSKAYRRDSRRLNGIQSRWLPDQRYYMKWSYHRTKFRVVFKANSIWIIYKDESNGIQNDWESTKMSISRRQYRAEESI
jgi:hypothetical protein